jgi:D-alanyl-D-alanine carboxypeptidase (penicillin-binding protein 5/6)
MLYIKPGDVYRRGDLLRVLLVKSMNDVARCLARDNAGSIDAFAAKMNAKAAQLGMANSHFLNPNGLPLPGQYSTARDMAKLAVAAYKNRTIRENVRLKEIQWRYPSGKTTTFKNTNRVLRNYALCNGMKTGYTEASGFCLVSSAATEGREVIVVVLGDVRDAVWVDSYKLLSWGLSS